MEAALEAYFTPADGDTQTLMFQKINEIGQGMKDVVTLLGTVIKYLESQAKPPPPRIATRDELYPELQPAVVATCRSSGQRSSCGPSAHDHRGAQFAAGGPRHDRAAAALLQSLAGDLQETTP